MIVVNNHHVIVPQIEDIAITANAVPKSSLDSIKIELFGDSIMCGRDPDRTPPIAGVCSGDFVTARVPDPPDELLVKCLPQFNLEVTTRSVGGSSSADLLQGTDGVNSSWPDDIQANIVIINHGLNDARLGVSVTDYRSNLVSIRQNTPVGVTVVWQTPTPCLLVNTAPYAETMINVAAEFNDIVADTHQIPNWTAKLPDGIHPRQLGYVELIDQCVAESVNKAIVKYLGADQHQFLRKNYQEKHVLVNQTQLKLRNRSLSNSWIEIYKNDNPTYQVISRGESDLYGILNAGFNDYKNQIPLFVSSNGFNLIKIKRSTAAPVFYKNYDMLTSLSAKELAGELNRTSHDYIVVISTKFDALNNRLTAELVEAMTRCGASFDIYQNALLKNKSAYVLVGIPGSGLGKGYESYCGFNDDDSISYAEIVFEVSAAGTIIIKDIFPALPTVSDVNANTIALINPMYNLISNIQSSVGSRIINHRYPTYKTNGIPYEQYNIHGDTVYFTEPITGILTIISDSVSQPPRAAKPIVLQNIHSLNYYEQRFNPARWAPGNVITTSSTTSNDPLAPPIVDGASGVNSLGLINTKLRRRVGDSHYAEPILISPPEHGTVMLSTDRKSFTYTPNVGFEGLDSFVYTMLSQHGQAGDPKSVYIEVVSTE
jgi:lysophospholipase L1-like esterase